MEINIEDLFNKRSIEYKDAISIIRKDLEAPPHGYIKKLCKQARLTYNTVIGLINNSINFEAPVLVLDLLVALGYDVKMTRETVSLGEGKKEYKEYTTYMLRKKIGVVAKCDPAKISALLNDPSRTTRENRLAKLTHKGAREITTQIDTSNPYQDPPKKNTSKESVGTN